MNPAGWGVDADAPIWGFTQPAGQRRPARIIMIAMVAIISINVNPVRGCPSLIGNPSYRRRENDFVSTHHGLRTMSAPISRFPADTLT